MKNLLYIVFIFLLPGVATAQCPDNINFSKGVLTNWSAYTGNFNFSPPVQQFYPSGAPAPGGTNGANFINEYNLTVNGITVNTSNGTDQFGGFETIPIINGYNYKYSTILGSTTVTDRSSGIRGGYIRGIQYVIDVPAGSPAVPYTITYAYAMVLENGSHTTSNQPIFYATVNSPNGKINCASATYNLPTTFTGVVNNNNGRLDSVFVMDEEFAKQQGFSLSPVLSPNDNGNNGEGRQRVWTKGWTEVTFNLAPYRGQQVTVTFEADNCVPGGHFAYAYIALRDDCGGLQISGPAPACSNTAATYSIPSLANASYSWSVPPGWQITSTTNTNIITVMPGSGSGTITVAADNGCTKLNTSIPVSVSPPTIAGTVSPDFEVCTGSNSSTLSLSGNAGQVLKWIASTDGINWTDIGNANKLSYAATNLTTTTRYRTLVQNGVACKIDTSTAAIVTVYPKSVGGTINPGIIDICLNQNKDANLILSGKVGSVLNWQFSSDNTNWTNFNPAIRDTLFSIKNQAAAVQYYRAVVQVGVCPAEASSSSKVSLINVAFPKAIISPADTTICYGDTATLTTTIQTGTAYLWKNLTGLSDPNNNKLPSTPYTFNAFASPKINTIYPISISNTGCPNPLIDTFRVNVRPPILPSAGNDTFIVAGQPLQLMITTAYTSEEYSYLWTPSPGLSSNVIYNPVATLNSTIDSVTYKFFVTDNIAGCTETNSIKVKIFKTDPDIFVPNAFTPNNDFRNDVLKPIPVGIKQFDYFKVYNRYGQLIYTTTISGQGWDGTLKGKEQPLGVYVWVAHAITYTGKIITRKGTVTLIR